MAKIEAISAEDIADAVAAAEAPKPRAAQAKAQNDLTATGRDATRVETNTVVEDRTDAPAVYVGFEYEVEKSELGDGTVLESFGAVKATD